MEGTMPLYLTIGASGDGKPCAYRARDKKPDLPVMVSEVFTVSVPDNNLGALNDLARQRCTQERVLPPFNLLPPAKLK